jgi:hypothetical protein
MTRRRGLWTTLLLVASFLAGWEWTRLGTHFVPSGQPALMTLDAASLRVLRSDFNEAADQTRIILLLSPT